MPKPKPRAASVQTSEVQLFAGFRSDKRHLSGSRRLKRPRKMVTLADRERVEHDADERARHHRATGEVKPEKIVDEPVEIGDRAQIVPLGLSSGRQDAIGTRPAVKRLIVTPLSE